MYKLIVCMVFYYFLAGCDLSILKQNTLQKSNIHPVESLSFDGEISLFAQRQRVDLFLIQPDELVSLYVSTVTYFGEDSNIYKWVTDGDAPSRVSKFGEIDINVIHDGETVFSTEKLLYDYIDFNTVCTGPDNRQQLLFTMVRGGTANGELQDMLFVYYDTNLKAFRHKVIEKRYLDPVCNMADAAENKRLEDEKIARLNLIFEQLQTLGQSPDLASLVKTGKSLPTRRISYHAFGRLLDEARHLVPKVIPVSNEEDSESEEYFKSTFVFEDLAESDRWRVVEFSYLQLWSSWGALLVQDRLTDHWTSFYTSSSGDSNMMLYLDNQVELRGDRLIGKFDPYAQQPYAISLEDFSVHQQ